MTTLCANARHVSPIETANCLAAARSLLKTAAIGAAFLSLAATLVAVRIVATADAFPRWHDELMNLIPFLG